MERKTRLRNYPTFQKTGGGVNHFDQTTEASPNLSNFLHQIQYIFWANENTAALPAKAARCRA